MAWSLCQQIIKLNVSQFFWYLKAFIIKNWFIWLLRRRSPMMWVRKLEPQESWWCIPAWIWKPENREEWWCNFQFEGQRGRMSSSGSQAEWDWYSLPPPLKTGWNHPLFYLVPQSEKNLLAVQETRVWSLGREDPLEKEMATHSSIPAWEIPWTEELGGLQPIRS